MQEATQQAKAAVNAARDRVKDNLEELKDIQAELQSAKQERAQGRDVNVEGLEKRISDIQVSMTASVEEAGREVSQVLLNKASLRGYCWVSPAALYNQLVPQATDKARRTVAGEAGSAQVRLVLPAKLLSLAPAMLQSLPTLNQSPLQGSDQATGAAGGTSSADTQVMSPLYS